MADAPRPADPDPAAAADEGVRLAVADGVATLTLDRPHALNALTPPMLERLGDHLAELAGRPEIRVVVLTGEGRAFSAGVDLKALGRTPIVDGAVGDVLDVPARRVQDLLTTMDAIVVAKVNGHCFTGALELVLACDLVCVAEEARLGDTHTRFGLRPTWGMSQRLPRFVGIAAARELTYTARTFDGREASALGLAVRCAPAAELDAVVDELVGALLANSSAALAAAKQLYREALDRPLGDGLVAEARRRFPISDTDERLAGFGR